MNKEFLDLAEQLKSSVSCTVRLNELMSGHTSFKIGGPADILVLPESIEQLREVLQAVSKTAVPLTLLGNGSNVLVRDKGIRGIVIKLGNMLRHFYETDDLLVFGFLQGDGMRQDWYGICRRYSGQYWRRRIYECRGL